MIYFTEVLNISICFKISLLTINLLQVYSKLLSVDFIIIVKNSFLFYMESNVTVHNESMSMSRVCFTSFMYLVVHDPQICEQHVSVVISQKACLICPNLIELHSPPSLEFNRWPAGPHWDPRCETACRLLTLYKDTLQLCLATHMCYCYFRYSTSKPLIRL